MPWLSPFTIAAAKGGAVKQALRPILAEIFSPEGIRSEMNQLVVEGPAGAALPDRFESWSMIASG
jgi:hypothetical protein